MQPPGGASTLSVWSTLPDPPPTRLAPGKAGAAASLAQPPLQAGASPHSPLPASISLAASRYAPQPSCLRSLPPSARSPRSFMPFHSRRLQDDIVTPVSLHNWGNPAAGKKTIHPDQIELSSSAISRRSCGRPLPGAHVSCVHPTILVRLPRAGGELGFIPNTPAGHLLYHWLAAFNQASYSALAVCSAQCRTRLCHRRAVGTPAADRRFQPALSQRGPARCPRLPAP